MSSGFQNNAFQYSGFQVSFVQVVPSKTTPWSPVYGHNLRRRTAEYILVEIREVRPTLKQTRQASPSLKQLRKTTPTLGE